VVTESTPRSAVKIRAPETLCRARGNGFTLLEVMVALAVVSIGMTAAVSLMSRNIDTTALLEERTYANWVAQNLVAEMKLDGIAATGVVEGEKMMAGRIWYWKADIKPTLDGDVLQVLITVSSEEDRKNTVTGITAYLSTAVSS